MRGPDTTKERGSWAGWPGIEVGVGGAEGPH